MTKKVSRIVVSNEFKRKLKMISAEADVSMCEMTDELAGLLDELKEKRGKKYEFKL